MADVEHTSASLEFIPMAEHVGYGLPLGQFVIIGAVAGIAVSPLVVECHTGGDVFLFQRPENVVRVILQKTVYKVAFGLQFLAYKCSQSIATVDVVAVVAVVVETETPRKLVFKQRQHVFANTHEPQWLALCLTFIEQPADGAADVVFVEQHDVGSLT